MTPPRKGFWTERRVRTLKILWRSNYSAAAIAAALQTTRRTIAGKIYRLRKAGDADIETGDLARALFAAAGIEPFRRFPGPAAEKERGHE